MTGLMLYNFACADRREWMDGWMGVWVDGTHVVGSRRIIAGGV